MAALKACLYSACEYNRFNCCGISESHENTKWKDTQV